MNEIRELLERRAEWQRNRRSLSWSEKVRMAERIRESVLILSRSRLAGTDPIAKNRC